MRVDLFDFELPDELIAQRPASPRDSARLLDVTGEALQDRTVRSLPGLLRRGDLLVFNDTKVIPARLKGVRPGNGVRQDVAAEALLIRDLGDRRWRSFTRPAKRLRPGDKLVFKDLGATVLSKAEDGSVVLQFDQEGHAFLTLLEQEGAVPLPPYIRGGSAEDRKDYQTVFAATTVPSPPPPRACISRPSCSPGSTPRHLDGGRHPACRRRAPSCR
jgi:S-adenosylmethionine:tRNA ribosyltransferase-isomerase